MKFPALLVVCFAAVFSEFIEAARNQTDDHSYRTLFCYQSGLDDPKLARQLRFRMEYNAACAALLCAAGKVEEGADSPEAAKLRKQALEWLTTDRRKKSAKLAAVAITDQSSTLVANGYGPATEV